jgi:hypothetical protein
LDEAEQSRWRLTEPDTTRAIARLPGLDIEIMHRRAVEGDAEQISINLRAAPSFEAFRRALEAANPLAFWAEGAQLAWLSWLEAMRALTLPWGLAPSLPRPGSDGVSRSERERSSSE